MASPIPTRRPPHLEQRRDIRRHPEWLPELRETLANARRFILELLESTEDGPVPPYRWRLPTRVHEQAWEELERGSSWAHQSSYEYNDLLDQLRARELRRVYLVHHPLYGHLSCETDTSLLAGGGQHWMETEGCYLTSASLEWSVKVGMYGEWDASGWRRLTPR